jgi:hypothetical protein
MSVSGARELRQVSRDLARAGSPGRGIRSKLRKEIVKAVEPMKKQVQSNAVSIPVKGTSGSTGLRGQIAKATRVQVKSFGRDTRVTLKVDGKKMPAGKGKLGVYMEGSDGRRKAAWRHPLFGDREVWVPQDSHPYFAPAIPPHLAQVNSAVIALCDATSAELLKGSP